MKKEWLLFMVFCLLIPLNSNALNPSAPTNYRPNLEQGGVLSYIGSIGPYRVEFTYMNLHMGDGAHFSYRYTSIRVNGGKEIELRYAGNKGKYQIWKEYINGRNTGTFSIIWTSRSITGTFVNSKGQRYNVNARRGEDNWADAGDSPFE